MRFLKGFRDFAVKGNAMDLAVGVIIGGAFGKIVTSLVSDILMPPIGLLIGGMNFTRLKWILKPATVDAAGKSIEAVSINYGAFFQTAFDFFIISFSIFLLIRVLNTLRHEKEQQSKVEAPPALKPEEALLSEIRDILKSQSASN